MDLIKLNKTLQQTKEIVKSLQEYSYTIIDHEDEVECHCALLSVDLNNWSVEVFYGRGKWTMPIEEFIMKAKVYERKG